MTIETAKFVVQAVNTQHHCAGSELEGSLKDGHILAVQQNSETAQHWMYHKREVERKEVWEMQDIAKIEADLGLVPESVSQDRWAFEADMLRGDDNTLYYFYYQYLLKSTDGFTWEIVNSDLPFIRWGINQNPSDGNGWTTQCSYIDGNIFVNYINHIWKSSDDGVTWKEVTDYQSHWRDEKDGRVKKAFHRASNTTMLFFATGKSDSYYGYMVYSLDAGETWTQYRLYVGRASWTVWLDDKQVFLFLTNQQQSNGGDRLYEVPWDAVINDEKDNYREVLSVPNGDYYSHDIFVVTPEFIILNGDFGTSYVLDHDYNILYTNKKGDCAFQRQRHITHVVYDPVSDDVLFGAYTRKANTTTDPRSGRFYLAAMNNGDYCQESIGTNTEYREGASMVYHPPTKRYYQATLEGVFYSFEQKPGDADFIELRTIESVTNLDDINDDALFCCTDTDGITYKVTGKDFKGLLVKPWDGADGIYHIKNFSSSGVKVKGYDKIYLIDGTDFGDVPSMGLPTGEYIITGVLTKFTGSTSNFEIGELTNTSKVTNMEDLFKSCSSYPGIGLEYLDLSNVTNASRAFYGCARMDGDVSAWDVSKVENMTAMFNGCSKFQGDVSKWDVSSLRYMQELFAYCSIFNSDVSDWDVDSVENMDYVFRSCTQFQGDVSRWNLVSVDTMYGLFRDAVSFNSDVTNWNVGTCHNMNYVFSGCTKFNQDISNWDTGNVTTMSHMFAGCIAFNADLSRWNVSKVTNMSDMFNGAKVFTSNLAHWDTGKAQNMQKMFKDAWMFTSDLSWWDTSTARYMDEMFYYAKVFDTDCSYWCVSVFDGAWPNNPEPPYEFAFGATNFTSPKPKWGVTCGPPKPGSPPPLP